MATTTTEIYTLSLHDALPIYLQAGGNRAAERAVRAGHQGLLRAARQARRRQAGLSLPRLYRRGALRRSEEHTSELQSQFHLVCRLLLEKKKNNIMVKLHEVIT